MREVVIRSSATREGIEREIALMHPLMAIRLSASHSKLLQVYVDAVWQKDMCVKVRSDCYEFVQKQIVETFFT